METRTENRAALDWALLAVRIIVGTIFMAHGAQKLFGAFGGEGLAATMQSWKAGPPIIGFLVAFGEFFGGLGMIVGFLSRFSAAAGRMKMLGAVALGQGRNGFFRWDGGVG